MDIYHIWADKEGDITDTEWVANMRGFLDHLIQEGKMESYRITRCKMDSAVFKIYLNGI